MVFDNRDTVFMERAMTLAEKGLGRTSPNPVVGAVIVRANEVIGEGYHAGPWRDHAEVDAIKDAVRRASEQTDGELSGTTGTEQVLEADEVLGGTTMYVTLEPCCTYGRTPPCTSALVAAGFARVVVGVVDPSPDVNGRGLQTLREAGIHVDLAEGEIVGRLKRQNSGVRKSLSVGLPFVTYKYAMTLDGRVATDAGDSRWISSAESRALVHRWRAWSDAVMVGAGTLRRDDPRLTARHDEAERQPLRVVVDPELGIAEDAALVQTAVEGPVLMICGPRVSAARRSEVESWGLQTEAVINEVEQGSEAGHLGGDLEPDEVARLLAARGVQTVLLEGGPRLAGSWWAAGLVDKVAGFLCPQVFSGLENRSPLVGTGAQTVADSLRLREVEVVHMGSDLLVTGYSGEPF